MSIAVLAIALNIVAVFANVYNKNYEIAAICFLVAVACAVVEFGG